MITTGKKPPSSRTKMTVNLLMALVILAELFIMFFMSFPRLDDLTWGGGNWDPKAKHLFCRI